MSAPPSARGRAPAPAPALAPRVRARGPARRSSRISRDALAPLLTGRRAPSRAPQVKQFCDSIAHLKSMGFREDLICGALLKHGGDVSAAITSCLDGS